MKKYILSFTFLLAFVYMDAQTIQIVKADPQPDFPEIYGGSFASGDIDGDGDNDLLLAGQNPIRKTELHINDGNGNFTKVDDAPFIATTVSVTIFEDLDGDGDLDLFLSGNEANGLYAHIYMNDGNGVFSELVNSSLPQFADYGVDIADVDGDGDKDLLIAVIDKDSEYVADVFLNDGSGIFTPAGITVFTPVSLAQVEFIDLENDGDQDVIISGENEAELGITTLYINDGAGNFTVDTEANLIQLRADALNVADTDNDGDLDILISGATNDPIVESILYINDGNGQFSELQTNLQKTFAGKNAFADLDNDGDQDLIMVGSQDGGLPNIYNIVYKNEGNNVFTPVDTLGGEYIASIVIDDYNGDQLPDAVIQGFADKMNVYWNTTVMSSTNEIEASQFIVMHPNPTTGELNIELEDNFGDFSLSVYSYDGQLVYEQRNLSAATTQLQLDLLAGTYVIQLRNEHAVITRRLVVVN